MKLLYVLDVPIDSIGGSQKSTLTCVKQMSKLGHEVDVLSPKHKAFFDISHITYPNKKIKILSNIIRFITLFKIYIGGKYDVIHAQNPESGMYLCLIGFFCKSKSKLVYTDREFIAKYPSKNQLIFKKFNKGLDLIITTTEINKDEWDSFSKTKVITIYNVLDEDWYTIEKRLATNEKINIGFSGRFVEYKRWDIVKKIIEDDKLDENYNFILAIGHTENDMIKLNQYIQSLEQLNKNITIKLNLNTNEMIDFYKSLDIFVLTSDFESFGRTLIEAMLNYTIVFGSDTGGVPNVIPNKNYLFNNENVEELINKIVAIQKNELDTTQEKFCNYCRDKFSLNNFIKKLNDAYIDIIQK